MVEVSQRHRDAAADFIGIPGIGYSELPDIAERIRHGLHEDPLVRAFAKFEASLPRPTPASAGDAGAEEERITRAITYLVTLTDCCAGDGYCPDGLEAPDDWLTRMWEHYAPSGSSYSVEHVINGLILALNPAAQAPEAGEVVAWKEIATVPNQTEVLVCNDCLLGWWAVAIESALGEWFYADRDGFHNRLKHEPTHWQHLPSIHPIALRKGRAHEN